MIKAVKAIALLFWLILPTLSYGAISYSSTGTTSWTDEKLNETLQKMDKAADAERWNRAIKYGEKALAGCFALKSETDNLCFTLMRKNSTYYYQADVHPRHSEDIATFYRLARAELGINHLNSQTLRDIYYKALLRKKRYTAAIPILKEMLQAEEAGENEPFRLLELTAQLYGLYHLTGQLVQEESTLDGLLPVVEDLLGEESDDYRDVLQSLAKNYCAQKKYHEFFTLTREQGLNLRCKLQ